MIEYKNVRLHMDTYEELVRVGKFDESVDDVVKRLLGKHKK